MQTYLNDVYLKTEFLAELTKHEVQNAIIKGTYGKMNGMFQGCAVGCVLHSLNVLQGKTEPAATEQTAQHNRYEAELGLPTWFAHLEDTIFENLPDDLAFTWPRRLAEAIPVGVVVNGVLGQILIWVLADAEFGVRYATDDDQIRDWIDCITSYIATDSHDAAAAAHIVQVAHDKATWDPKVGNVARAAWVAWGAWDIKSAARAVWIAGMAWDAWDDANSSRATKKAIAFFPALSEMVLGLVRALPKINRGEAK